VLAGGKRYRTTEAVAETQTRPQTDFINSKRNRSGVVLLHHAAFYCILLYVYKLEMVILQSLSLFELCMEDAFHLFLTNLIVQVFGFHFTFVNEFHNFDVCLAQSCGQQTGSGPRYGTARYSSNAGDHLEEIGDDRLSENRCSRCSYCCRNKTGEKTFIDL